MWQTNQWVSLGALLNTTHRIWIFFFPALKLQNVNHNTKLFIFFSNKQHFLAQSKQAFSLSSASKAHDLPVPAIMLMLLSLTSSLPLNAGPAEIPAHAASCTFWHSYRICAHLFNSTKNVRVSCFLFLHSTTSNPHRSWFRGAGSGLAKLSPDSSTNKTSSVYYYYYYWRNLTML